MGKKTKEVENGISKIINAAEKEFLETRAGQSFNSVYEFESMFRIENAIAWAKHKEAEKALKALQRHMTDLTEEKFMIMTDIQCMYDNLLWSIVSLVKIASLVKVYQKDPVDTEVEDNEENTDPEISLT